MIQSDVVHQMREKDHLENKGGRCPFCGSEDTEGDSVDTGGGEANQGMHCAECGERWSDLYTLTGLAGPGRYGVNKIKVVICVRGGVVQGVWANTQNIEVRLYDFDDVLEGESDKEIRESEVARDKQFEAEIEALDEVTLF